MALILSGDTGVPASGMPTGSVLQVIQASTPTYVYTTTSTYVDSGLTVSITPKFATSKILINAYCGQCAKQVDTQLNLQLVRGSTSIFLAAALNQGGSVNMVGNPNFSYLDSPATTSSTTYKIQYASRDGGTVQFNTNGTAVIIAMEIQG